MTVWPVWAHPERSRDHLGPYIPFKGNMGLYIPFKGNIRGYLKSLLKANLGYFGSFWLCLAL